MKNIFAFLGLFLMLMLFTSFTIAQTQVVVISDTMGNSQKSSFEVGGFADCDSITFSLYASGEIDIDTLGIQLYETVQAKYLGTETSITRLQSKNATYSTVLTVNLADGVDSYTGNVVTIPKSAWKGYNRIVAYLKAAASGNDTSDDDQKAVLIVNYYK